MSKKRPATPKDLPGYIIAAGGEVLEVQSLTKKKPETVMVYLIRAAAYPDFLTSLLGNTLMKKEPNDERLAELVCAKPKGWGETLHPLSVQEIKEKAVSLNFTPAQKWAETTGGLIRAQAKGNPAAEKALEDLLKKATGDSPSSSGSTTSPSTAPTSSSSPSAK